MGIPVIVGLVKKTNLGVFNFIDFFRCIAYMSVICSMFSIDKPNVHRIVSMI